MEGTVNEQYTVITNGQDEISRDVESMGNAGWKPIMQSSCFDDILRRVMVTITLERTRLRFPSSNEKSDM